MPVYEYRCTKCEDEFEMMRKFSDPPLDCCPKCGKGPVEKLISRNSFALKGGGWYASDYASGGSTPKAKSKPSCPGSGGGCSGCPGSAS